MPTFYIKKTPKTLALACFVLLEAMTLSHGEIPGVDEVETRWLCEVQSKAYCYSIMEICDNYCSESQDNITSKNVEWIVNCTQKANNLDDVCNKLCTISANGTDETPSGAIGYPEPHFNVTVTRDAGTRQIVLSCQPSLPPTPAVVYVLVELQENMTDISHRLQSLQVLDNTLLISSFTDICTVPAFRVATVSDCELRGFSESVRTPDLIPGPPLEIHLLALTYTPIGGKNETIYFTLDWRPPEGWAASDIGHHNVVHKTSCEQSNAQDVVYIFTDAAELAANDTTEVFKMSGRIPTYAFGCNITFEIQAVSRCQDTMIGTAGKFTIEFKCGLITNYAGRYCDPPQVIPPGQVKDVRLIIIPTTEDILSWVSWSPPNNLGSAGRVELYHLFWGVIDLMNHDPINMFKSVLGHTTVQGAYLYADLNMSDTLLNRGETIGVVVSAAGPGQEVDVPLDDVYLPTNKLVETGQVLMDDRVVIAVQVRENMDDNSAEVDVYWRRYKLENVTTDTIAYAVQWGMLSNGNITFRNSSNTNFQAANFNITEQEFIKLFDLLPNATYGLKVVPISSDSDSVQDEMWNNAEPHMFTTLRGPEIVTVTLPPFITETTPVVSRTGLASFVYIVLSLTGVLILLCAILIFHKMRRRQHRQRVLARAVMADPEFRDYFMFMPGTSLENTRNAHCPVVADEWELPLSGVKFGPILGSGAFGKVVKGRVTKALLTHRGVSPLLERGGACFQGDSNLHVTVAIKMLQDDVDARYKQDFLKEMQLMKRVGHHENVVSMLGCCTLRDPICLIVEHAEFGDLLNYLKDVRHKMISMPDDSDYVNRDADRLTYQDLLTFAWHTARGMDFLASKGFVHRDLAARNVLVFTNKLCKIGDFGLARYVYDDAIYVNRRGGRLPVKWMSLEAIFDLSFSTASDVWSFGILLYELATLGGTPYPTIPTRELLNELRRGYRMERPVNCSSETYEMMLQCWQADPKDRPSFSALTHWLEDAMTRPSTSEHPEVFVSFNQDLYSVEDDNDVAVHAKKTAMINEQSSVSAEDRTYHDVVLSDDTHNNCSHYHKSLSEDSGYSSPQKESVSSGESSLTVSAETAQGFMDQPSDAPTDLKSEAANRLQFLGVLSENDVDDVFQDDDNNVPINEITWTTKLGKTSHHKCGLIKVGRSNSWSPGMRPVRKVYAGFRTQAASELSEGSCVDTTYRTRRKSDSELLDQICRKTSQFDQKTRSVSHRKSYQVSKRRSKFTEKKQRRKAVVIPPSLALDNNLYYAMAKLPRQQPPVLQIPRKKHARTGLDAVSPAIWTRDGQFNFKRSKANISSNENSSILPAVTGNQELEQTTRTSPTTQMDTHIENDDELSKTFIDISRTFCYPSCKNSLEALSAESLEQDGAESVRHLQRYSRKRRMFVKSASSVAPLEFANLSEATTNRNPTFQSNQCTDHQYADFKDIINQSAALINNQEIAKYHAEETSVFPEYTVQNDNLILLNESHTLDECPLEENCFDKHDNPPSCWKNTLDPASILEVLSQALRRTYSSPKEHAVTQNSEWSECIVMQPDGTFVSTRRLSDPASVHTDRILKLTLDSKGVTAKSSRSRWGQEIMLDSRVSSSNQASRRFLWSPSRRRKENGAARVKSNSVRKAFPHERHPTALHLVASREVCKKKYSLDLPLS